MNVFIHFRDGSVVSLQEGDIEIMKIHHLVVLSVDRHLDRVIWVLLYQLRVSSIYNEGPISYLRDIHRLFISNDKYIKIWIGKVEPVNYSLFRYHFFKSRSTQPVTLPIVDP